MNFDFKKILAIFFLTFIYGFFNFLNLITFNFFFKKLTNLFSNIILIILKKLVKNSNKKITSEQIKEDIYPLQ